MKRSSTSLKERRSEYADFEVFQEPWSEYRLSDGTVLRSRFVLLKIGNVKSPDGQEGAKLSNQIVNVIQAPRRLMGPVGGTVPVEELQKHIVVPDMHFETRVEKPSVYLVSGERVLIVRTRVSGVSRTSLYDAEGAPHYLVTSMNMLATSPSLGAALEEFRTKTLLTGSGSRRRSKTIRAQTPA
ncbi:MAG: hypothetical protein WB778_04175 [Thermoplasmata archaeon]